jgi:hypothetical protein
LGAFFIQSFATFITHHFACRRNVEIPREGCFVLQLCRYGVQVFAADTAFSGITFIQDYK